MSVELTDDPSVFRSPDWASLVEVDPAGTFFHTPAYLKVWWEEFGSGALLLTAVKDHLQLVGACAFEVIDGTLQFLGGFDVTDYMGPVARPGKEEEVSGELLDALLAVPWRKADLRGLPEESPWLPALAGASSARGLFVERAIDGVAPLIRLPGSYDGYLAALPGKLRHELQRKERRLAAEIDGYRVTLATPETVRQGLDRFVELHRASPGPKGKFMHAGMEIFFRRLGEAFLAPHQFHLAFLEVDGVKVAGAIGFAHGGTFSLYNSAFDRAFGHLAPGVILVTTLIREAANVGRDRFDMLKGDLEYKYRFGAAPRTIGRLVLSR